MLDVFTLGDVTDPGCQARAGACGVLSANDHLPSTTIALKLLAALFLPALTVTIHAAGLTWVLRRVLLATARPDTHFWRVVWLLVRVVWALLLLHAAEIAVWALFYWWQECLPDLESSTYFSGVTYATVGFGDLVLPKEWRMLSTVEGLTGILMCGLSTGFFFALMSRVYGPRARTGTPER